MHGINEVDSGTHPWSYERTYGKSYRFSAHRADRILVPPESTRLDIERYYGISGEEVNVVVQGADESFRPIADEARQTLDVSRQLSA